MTMRRGAVTLLVLLALVAAIGWFVKNERATRERVGVTPTKTIVAERALDEGGARVAVTPEPEPTPAAEGSLPADEQPSQVRQLRVRVLDGETGNPVHEAGVYLESESPRMMPYGLRRLESIGYAETAEDVARTEPYFADADEEFRQLGDGITDPDGVAVVELEEPVPWIRVRKGERFGMARCPQHSDSVTILLKPLEQLEIEVVDRSGRPAEGALVVELQHSHMEFTDRAGRLRVPVIATQRSDGAEKLDFLLPLADTQPPRHVLGSGDSPNGPLRFVLGECGTLELLATSDGTRIENFELEFRVRIHSREGEESGRTLDHWQSTLAGSIRLPHVSPGRKLSCGIIHLVPFSELVFPRVEFDSTEPGRAVTVREIPLQRGLVRFRGIAVDESGSPLAKAWVNAATDAVVNGQLRPNYLALDGGAANDAGKFDILEFWHDHGRLPDWEPGSSFEFEAICKSVSYLATVRTPPWTCHTSVSRLRWLDFGTVVFRRTPPGWQPR
jgi:hypothetical protein